MNVRLCTLIFDLSVCPRVCVCVRVCVRACIYINAGRGGLMSSLDQHVSVRVCILCLVVSRTCLVVCGSVYVCVEMGMVGGTSVSQT